jgi:hypothetical protein
MRKRGGYPGDRRHALKLRVNDGVKEVLTCISEERGVAMAVVLRELVSKGLEQMRREAGGQTSAG